MSSVRLCFFVLALLAVGGSGLSYATPGSAALSFVQASGDEAPRIKPEEVRELLKKDKAVLLDVRSEAAYKSGHIKGALNIPVSEISDRSGELPRDKMIVAYCS